MRLPVLIEFFFVAVFSFLREKMMVQEKRREKK